MLESLILGIAGLRLRPARMISAILAAVACFVAASGAAYAQAPVKIGFSDSPPISSRDPATGELRGLAVAVFSEISKDAGFAIQAQMMSFGDLLPALAASTVDVVTMSGTPERRKLAAFSNPFVKYGEALLARSEDATAYVSLDQLRGKRVGSNAGGGWLDAAQKAGAEVATFSGAEQSLQALEKGEVQAVVGNAPTYIYLLRSGAFPHVRLVTSYIPRQTNELAFGVRLADAALLERIGPAIERLAARGVLERLKAEWGFQ